MINLLNFLKKSFFILIDDDHRIFTVIILSGIVIRLILLPIAMHSDLLSVVYRQSFYLFDKAFKVGGITELLLLPYMVVIKPLINHFPQIVDITSSNKGTVSYDFYWQFVSHPLAMRYIGLFKIPYLIVDVAIIPILWKIFKNRNRRIVLISLWALNPTVLFAAFVWGRFEVIPIFLVLLSFYFASKNRALWSIVFLSLAVSSRVGYLLAVPFFLIYFSKTWKDYIYFGIIFLLPYEILEKILFFLSGVSASGDAGVNFLSYFTHSQFGNGFTATSLMVLVYPVIIYLFYIERGALNLKKLIYFSSFGMLSFFAFGLFHPQYLAWLAPFLMLASVYHRKNLIAYLALIFFGLIYISAFYGPRLTWGLFAPLDGNFFNSIGSLAQQPYLIQFDPLVLTIIFHSSFVASILIFSIILYRGRNEVE